MDYFLKKVPLYFKECLERLTRSGVFNMSSAAFSISSLSADLAQETIVQAKVISNTTNIIKAKEKF